MSRQRRNSASHELSSGETPASGTLKVTSTPQRESPRSGKRAVGRSSRAQSGNIFTRYLRYSAKNMWVTPLVFVVTVLSGYLVNPTPTNPLRPFIFFSYPVPMSKSKSGFQEYDKGLKDLLFVGFYTALFSFVREFMIQRVLPHVAHYYGITKKAKVARFMEQTYTALYCSLSSPFGLYVMYHTPIWYFNTKAFWEDYPHRTHTADFKAYYLLQGAFWMQQAIVLLLQLEKPRKDFKELVLHHIVTLSLIALSYRFHFTWIGLAVYITHDISDFFLASSKLLNYIDVSFIGPYFVLFTTSWVYCRHYLNIMILKSVITEMSTVGSWELNWETGTYKSELAQTIAFSLLASLQALNIFWFYLILMVAKKYVFREKLEDVRSEDEESADEQVEEKPNGKLRANKAS